MGMTAEPAYRYFAHPRAPVVTMWRPDPGRCELCERLLPGYEGSFYGERDCDFVCEECLLAGKLEAAGLSTNDPDLAALRDQLREVEEPERSRLIEERTGELKFRTPSLVTWQQLAWPACCGDFLRFEGEIGREEMDALAEGGSGWQWFLDHVRDELPKEFEASDLAPRASNATEQWSLVAYHFRCLHCRRSAVLWDCD